MRGCGESEGEHGNLICLEQVEDTKQRADLPGQAPGRRSRPHRRLGPSFGGAVAVYAGGVDARIAASSPPAAGATANASSAGSTSLPRHGRGSPPCSSKAATTATRPGSPSWCRATTSCRSRRHLRNNLAANSIHSFTAETAQSMYDFSADDVVGRIAPRPLLLLHSSNDSVTPTEQSVELFKRAGQPTELHLIATPTTSCSPRTTPACGTCCADGLLTIFRSAPGSRPTPPNEPLTAPSGVAWCRRGRRRAGGQSPAANRTIQR